VDVASAPFGGLADVDQGDAAVGELFGHRGGVDVGGSGEEVHGSVPGGVLDATREFAAHVGGDWCELVVADDREHALGIDGGDVCLPMAGVDDDVSGE
jgi:hypothetical protein